MEYNCPMVTAATGFVLTTNDGVVWAFGPTLDDARRSNDETEDLPWHHATPGLMRYLRSDDCPSLVRPS